jgi:U3 small nucleolar RNA-associated protein 20
VQFKTFSQRVEEIDIDVFRSLHAVKAEPSSGSSFFLDALMEWRVCDFYSSCFTYFNFCYP